MRKPGKNLVFLAAAVLIAGSSAAAEAGFRDGGDPMMRPQVGIWFGPVTPVYTLWDELEPYLGGGVTARVGLFRYGKLGFDASYQKN
ncbi:MAG: hypothetical protein ACRCUT_06505, partial [Spirochaetota bacterium]